MTPDKLPEEIEIQISKDAITNDVANRNENYDFRSGFRRGYAVGATAWAMWKVRHDGLEAAYLALQMEQLLLKQQAQCMADALDIIGNGPFPITQKELEEWLLKMRSMARKALQQFKDGKGKEVENGIH